jgi:TIR domain
VFINYRCSDAGVYAALLYLYLAMSLGDDQVFMDSVSIPAGHDYTVELLDQARNSAVVIVVIGPRWLARGPEGRRLLDDPLDWVRRELIVAMAAGARVIPVLVDGAEPPVEPELPAELRQVARCQYRRLRIRDVMVDLDRLRKDLLAAEVGRPKRASLPRLNVMGVTLEAGADREVGALP